MLLKISGLARSTYYYHSATSKTDKYKREKDAILEIFHASNDSYGYRRITDVMKSRGFTINHKTVCKLMKELKICGKKRKNGQYHSYKGEIGKIAGNILNRNFYADKPFEKLATDATQFNIQGTKVYLSPIMDLYNNEIVAYSISLSPNLDQIREMLNELSKKFPKGARPVLHSDQGWQYQHKFYQQSLEEMHITQSMSRKGNCMDNGAMECFFGRLKVEMYYGEKFKGVDDFIQKLRDYISYWNNTRIIHSKLKGMSPVEYRQTHSLAS